MSLSKKLTCKGTLRQVFIRVNIMEIQSVMLVFSTHLCELLPPNHGRRNFKDTNPLMSSSMVILFGVVKQFCRFWIWSETECKTPAEYGPQYISTPPPTVTHCLYTVLYIGKGGGRRRSERRYSRGATVHKYHIVPLSMGATAHKLGRKYKPWVNVSPVYKIC